MKAGELKRHVTIEKLDGTRDGFGQEIPSWVSFAAGIWCKIEPLTGREIFNAQQVQAEVTHRITMRYLSGVVAKMRINWNGRIFDIHSVRNLNEQSREIELLALERV
jgi:SPP1 family predicted phage head-tail adaptor